MLNSYIDNWCLFDSIDGPRESQPCRCCSVGNAMDDSCDSWTCASTGRRWLILENPPELMNHSMETCPGNCRLHPLMSTAISRWWRGSAAGASWEDLLLEEEAVINAAKSAAQLAAEKSAKAATAAKMEREIETGAAACHIRRVQEAQAMRYAARGKIAQPCKKLYSCCGGGKAGGVAKPTTLHVSSECWRYEYTDPETGRLNKVHTCNWLHPGEDGWQTQWATNRNYMPAEPIQVAGAVAAPGRGAPNRFGALGGKPNSGHHRGGAADNSGWETAGGGASSGRSSRGQHRF
jgi:hypothetical protein